MGVLQRAAHVARRPMQSARYRSRRRVDRFTMAPDVAALQAPRGDLTDLFFAHDGRLLTKWVHYLGVYERHLDPFRSGFPVDGGTRPLRLLEIGVLQGGSMQLWRKYLGPDAVIFGVDVDPRCAGFDGTEGRVRIGSQADQGFLRAVVEEMGGVDVVIDDGSHRAKDQRLSFDALFPLLSFGGLYIAEDTHTSYWPWEYSGGLRRPGTFVEVAKGLVDGMHAWYYGWPHSRRNRWAKTEISAVSFYDSMVVIEKNRRQAPGMVNVGTPAR